MGVLARGTRGNGAALQADAHDTERAGSGGVEQVGFQHLQLQRHRQPVRVAAQAATQQHLARLDHLAADQGLQPVEVELAIRIGAPEFDTSTPILA